VWTRGHVGRWLSVAAVLLGRVVSVLVISVSFRSSACAKEIRRRLEAGWLAGKGPVYEDALHFDVCSY
jgi:hypothetical protein